MHPTLLLIPTYNERTNAPALVEEILSLDLEMDLLFIDDASTDGTDEVLDRISEQEPSVQVMHRPGKLGLGSAYRDGFRYSLEHGYTFTICMDADLSHDPGDLPRFLEELLHQDLVCGSRYLPEGEILNWPLNRLLLSRAAAVYTRLLTRMPLTDPTGGYNAYRNAMLYQLPLENMTSNGYSFQIEMKVLAWKHPFRVKEIPIVFTERREGKSKMSPGIVREAIWVVWKLLLGR